MQTTTVSRDATGLPAFISTPATARKTSKREYVRRQKPIDPSQSARVVIFKRDLGENGRERITAVFPCEPAMDGQMLGFNREEGYMSCSRLWFDLSKAASAEDAKTLVSYLTAKGGKLDIRHRITPAMDTTRAYRREAEKRHAAFKTSVDVLSSQPDGAFAKCLQAIEIVSTVTGIPSQAIVPEAGELSTPRPARWAAMSLSHTVFAVSLADIAGVYGRTEDGVARTLRRLDETRSANGVFATLLARMERAARRSLTDGTAIIAA